eukprot:scaffold194932_cov19-Tisochrysis_lutea.AAC.1
MAELGWAEKGQGWNISCSMDIFNLFAHCTRRQACLPLPCMRKAGPAPHCVRWKPMAKPSSASYDSALIVVKSVTLSARCERRQACPPPPCMR